MGYNLAKEKMKKQLLTSVLAILMVVGATFSSAYATTETKCDNESPVAVSINKEACISGNFIAREDGHIIGSLLLRSDCTFRMVERDDYDVTTTDGTYLIDGNISRGQMADIEFFVNGCSQGTARMAWPEEQGLCIFINGYVFEKE